MTRRLSTGNGLANTINGNSGANTLSGMGGADVLNGGLGADVLVGGAGADTFRFSTALDGLVNVDTISDFSVVDDTIQLAKSVFGALPLGTLSAGAFVIGTEAADGGDRIIYNSSTGAVLYDADGAGGAAAIRFATLASGLGVTRRPVIVRLGAVDESRVASRHTQDRPSR